MKHKRKQSHRSATTLSERKKLDKLIAEHVLEINFVYDLSRYLFSVEPESKDEIIDCFRQDINMYSRLLKQNIIKIYEYRK